MPKEYVEREKITDILETAIDLQGAVMLMLRAEEDPEMKGERKAYKDILKGVKEIPAADVVGVPEWMTKDELLDILRAAREGRLKITAPPIETTCGSCRHFQPYPGMASGKCDCRMKRNRRGEPTGEVLYVTQSHKACRDDYEQRAE